MSDNFNPDLLRTSGTAYVGLKRETRCFVRKLDRWNIEDNLSFSLLAGDFDMIYRVSPKKCSTFDQILKNNDSMNRLMGR